MKKTRADDQTEILLQGLIFECGEIIRTQLRPAIDATDDHYQKTSYTQCAVSLVRIASTASDAVAHLRGANNGPETRHRITVERVAPQAGTGGEG